MTRFLNKQTGHFIGGEFIHPSGGKTFATINPATGLELSQVACGGDNEVDLAVQAAKSALRTSGWALWPYERRAEVLTNLAAIITHNLRDLAVLESMDTGKPV